MGKWIFGGVILGGLVGCGGEASVAPADPGPVVGHVAALSTYEASLGTLVEAYGTQFPAPAEGQLSLVFRGEFRGADGETAKVELAAPVRRVDSTTLRWTGFGPYQNPFRPGAAPLGVLSGTVGVRLVTPDGAVHDEASPVPLTFTVAPSLQVEELQPTTASCNGGVLRALGGAPYRLAIRAHGFTPTVYQVAFSAPNAKVRGFQIRTLAKGDRVTLGGRGDLILPPVPDGVPSYGAILELSAQDEAGRVVRSVFGLTVHRPIEVYYNGNVEVGEVLAPVPVSGCIPGGLNGRDAEYSEAESETRSRGYDVSWNQSWLSQHTVEQGSGQTVGLSETNGVGFATTDGQSFSFSLGTEVGGTFGLSELVSLGVKANATATSEVNRSDERSANRSSGVNRESSTTETESLSEANERGEGQGFSWEVNSSQQISRGFGGRIIAGSYGVFYRQTLRLVRRAAVVAYNQCGQAQVVGDVDFSDWTWSPDLALGPACPPLPPSNLPPASCLVPPCSNGS